VTLLAHAIVVPTSDPEETKRRDDRIEAIAMQVAIAFEEANGATVKDVHTPEFSQAVGLGDYPGFDLLSRYPGGTERVIEVKGRTSIGEILVSENEWSSACNHRSRYWFYVVYDCGSSSPTLLRIQDPFEQLLVKSQGGVKISSQEILLAAKENKG
jgi:hypothetical protein